MRWPVSLIDDQGRWGGRLMAVFFCLACAACMNLPVPASHLGIAAVGGAANLAVTARDPAAYRTTYLSGGPWTTVTGTLAHAGQAPVSASGTVSIDPTTHARSAQLGFAGLPPGGGYTLTLAFGLSTGAGSPVDAGSMTTPNLTLAPGSNTLQLDVQAQRTPLVPSPAPLGRYVETFPAAGMPAVLRSIRDVVNGIHGDYYYLDDNTVHRLYHDANGNLTTATVAGVAGTANAGSVDGPGLSARFNQPNHLVVAPDGSLYISDAGNNQIRKVSFDALGNATVSTVAGTGVGGKVDGPGASAEFWTPQQIALDPSGNLVVADQINQAIRLVTLSGPGTPMVTTIAGTNFSYRDGPATGAAFNYPEALAVDANGRIFVSDTSSPRIRMLTPGGGTYTVSTVAGTGLFGGGIAVDGAGLTAPVGHVISMALDAAGNIDFVDGHLRQLSFDASGNPFVRTLAGGPGSVPQGVDAAASDAYLWGATSLAMETDGSILLADAQTIQTVTTPGQAGSMVLRQVGTYRGSVFPDSDGAVGTLGFLPISLAADSNGNAYTVQGDTEYLAEAQASAPLSPPLTLAPIGPIPSNDADDFTLTSEISGLATQDGLTFYYCHQDNPLILRMTRPSLSVTDLTATTVAGAKPGGASDGPGNVARFSQPSVLTFGPDGSLYCGDASAVRRISFQPDGSTLVATLIGQPGFFSNPVDGPPTLARFSQILGMAFDPQGQLWVVDGISSNRLRKVTFDAQGNATTVTTVLRGSVDFDAPVALQAIAISRDGTFYIADTTRIYTVSFDSHQQPHTHWLAGGEPGYADGPLASARFQAIDGLAVTGSGFLCVADRGNGLLRRIRL